MNLTELLKFLPLLIGAFLAYHLIFKQNLPTKNIGSILTYFIGIIIVFVAISWLITTFLAGWATDMLEAGTTSPEWSQFINQSEGVVEDAFGTEGSGTNPTTVQVQQTNQQQIIVLTPTPVPGTSSNSGNDRAFSAAQSGTYTVAAGDTVTKIAQKYNKTVEAIVQANGLTNPNSIYPGQELVIPGQ
ncbi:MAG: LysM domain-containing protein [Chloroflexota bacterium]